MTPKAYIEKRRRSESLRAIARSLGVSAPYLVDIVAGRRNAGPKLLAGIAAAKKAAKR